MMYRILKALAHSSNVCWRRFALSHEYCLTAIIIALLLFPSIANAENLKQAIRAVYENNPALLAERARQRADDEVLPQALAGLRPTIDVGGSIGREKKRTSPPPIHTDLKPSNLNISLSQPIFRGLRTLNSTRKAKAEVLAGREMLLDKEQTILLSAVTAFADVLRDRRIVTFRNANVRFLAQELRATETRRKEGVLTRTDTDQARSRLYQGQANLAQARAELASSEAQYAAIIGHRPGRLVPPPSITHHLPQTLQTALSISEAENPLIIAATYRKEAAAHEVHVLRGELLPTVSLDATYQRDYDLSATTSRQDEASVELRFSMPLYNAGTNFSKIRQARAVLEQRKHDMANTLRDVQASVKSAWQQRIAGNARINATRIGVFSALAALKGVRLEAKVGERSVFDILNAQRDVVNAEVNLAQAQRDHVVASFTLLATVGGLTADQLDLDTPIYNPKDNLKALRRQIFWMDP